MKKNIIKLTENEIRCLVSESIRELIREGYFNDNATPEQRVNAAQEITDTYNDSNLRKETNRPIGIITTMDFIRQNGGLQKVGKMPIDQLMQMIHNYIN